MNPRRLMMYILLGACALWFWPAITTFVAGIVTPIVSFITNNFILLSVLTGVGILGAGVRHFFTERRNRQNRYDRYGIYNDNNDDNIYYNNRYNDLRQTRRTAAPARTRRQPRTERRFEPVEVPNFGGTPPYRTNNPWLDAARPYNTYTPRHHTTVFTPSTPLVQNDEPNKLDDAPTRITTPDPKPPKATPFADRLKAIDFDCNKLEDEFTDPVTFEIMEDPVELIAEDNDKKPVSYICCRSTHDDMRPVKLDDGSIVRNHPIMTSRPIIAVNELPELKARIEAFVTKCENEHRAKFPLAP